MTIRHLKTLLAWAGLTACAAAFADYHGSNLPAEPQFDSELQAEIEQFLVEYEDAYNRQDYDRLLGMWDQSDATPMYMAEELETPLYGWQRLRAYFNPKPGAYVLDGIRNRYSDVRAHYLADDLAFATYKLEFDIKVRGQQPLSSWDRVVAVFRRVDGDWKMTTYAEAPMAPLTMVRKMLRGKVPDDFDEYIEAHKEERKARDKP